MIPQLHARMRQVLAAMGVIALGSMFWGAPAVSASSASLPSTTGGVHGYAGIAGQSGHNFTSNELKIISSQSDMVVITSSGANVTKVSMAPYSGTLLKG